MNMELKSPLRVQKTKLEIVDCDFHPRIAYEQLKPHLSDRWWQYLHTYGIRARHGHAKGYQFPKITPLASRRDAWPPGGVPGSDIDFIRKQHLDFYGIDHAILTPLSPAGFGEQNADFSAAMATAANEAQAVIVPSVALTASHQQRMVDLAIAGRIPLMATSGPFAEVGALISYHADLRESFRHVADYVSRTLKGTNPADLPVLRPTKFELVVNLKTAKALGLALPDTLVARADDVIE